MFLSREEQLPIKAVVSDLLDLVWKNHEWIQSIFDLAKSTVNKYNVEAMFLQLIASGLLEVRRKNGEWYYMVAKARYDRPSSPYKYE